MVVFRFVHFCLYGEFWGLRNCFLEIVFFFNFIYGLVVALVHE